MGLARGAVGTLLGFAAGVSRAPGVMAAAGVCGATGASGLSGGAGISGVSESHGRCTCHRCRGYPGRGGVGCALGAVCVRAVAGASAGVGTAGGGRDPRVTRGRCGRWGRGRVSEL